MYKGSCFISISLVSVSLPAPHLPLSPKSVNISSGEDLKKILFGALQTIPILFVCLFLRFYLFIFRERGRGRETGKRVREGEKHRDVRKTSIAASCAPPVRYLARNPGVRPDWESNQQSFGLQASTQPTEPHQAGLGNVFLNK